MGVSVARTRVAANTSSGTQDITVSGIGTPKLAIFTFSWATADNTATDGLLHGMGVTDGTAQACRIFTSAHGGASSTTGVDGSTSRVILINDPADNLTDAYAVFTQWITDGVQITWTVTSGRAILIDVEFWYGTDLSVDVITPTLTTTVNVATDVNGVGFEPDDVITISSNGNGFGIGFTHNDRAGGITQIASVHRERSGRPTMEVYSKIDDSYGGVIPIGGFSEDLNSWLEFSSFDSSGFSVTPRVAGGAALVTTFISFRYGTSPVVESKVYVYTTPTGTGNSTDSTPNFQPQAVHYVGTLMEAVDTYYSDSLAGSSCWSAVTSSNQNCTSWSNQDAAADSNTQSLIDDVAVNLPLHDGSAGMAATYSSMQSTGVQLNWSDIESAGKKWLAWAVETFVSGSNWTKTLTDTTEISDTISRIIGKYKTLTDTTNIADTISRIINKVKSIANTVNISDAITSALVILKALVSWIRLQIPQATTGNSFFATLTDTIETSDTISWLRNLAKTISNTVNISDTISRVINKVKSILDTIEISDTISKILNKVKSLANTVQVSDTISTLKGMFKSISNTVNVSDTISNIRSILKSISNTINISDTLTRIVGKIKSISNSIQVSDTITNIRSLFRTLTDTTNISDTIASLLVKIISIADSISISDTLSTIRSLIKSIANSINVSDTIAKTIGRYKTISNSINISDTISRSIGRIKSIANTINISDTILNLKILIRNISNTINVSDTITTVREIFKNIANSINIADTLTRAINFIKSISNTVQVSDVLSNIRNLVKSISDTINISDTLLAAKAILISIANTLNISDTISKSIGRFKTLTDTVNISDTLSKTIAKIVAIANSVSVSDDSVNTRGIYRTFSNIINIADSLASSVFEHAHPSGEITNSGWTNELDESTDIYTSIDEIIPDDNDYIQSPENPLPEEIYEVRLGVLSAPYLKVSHSLYYRYKKSSSSAVGLIVKLLQGNSEIAIWGHENLPETFTTIEQSLTQDQMNSITDYTDLRIRFIPSGIV